MDARATDFGSLTAGRGRLLASLLVVALLLCHGALGALHGASQWPAVQAGEHHAHAAALAGADHGNGPHGDPATYAHCAVALFVVLLGAALVLWGGLPARRLVASCRACGRVPLPPALLPPRGPTLPLLQVFRL